MMKIKLNWGKGIMICMGAFMTFIVILGVQMFRASPGDYDKQYYEKGLAYDSVYTKEKQVITDKAEPQLRLEHRQLYVQFTATSRGRIRFERPSDPDLDRGLPFMTPASNTVVIPMNSFAKGQWQITLEWESAGKKYLYQRELFLP